MRTPSIADSGYIPGPAPSELQELPLYIETELRKIAAAINALALVHVQTLYAAPSKPREGDTYLADGTSWNPGAGKGVYTYYSGTWNRLG